MVEVETPHDSFRKLIAHPILQGCVVVAVALGLALIVEVPNRFPDPDAFYHAGMAELAAQGVFPHQFPWLDLTTLRSRYADLHLLYHLALVPFVRMFGPMAGIRIATILAVAGVGLAFLGLCRALKVRGAFACTLLLLGSAAFLFRVNLAKAQGLAFIVLFLGLATLVHRSRTGVFLAAVFATWTSSHWPVLLLAVAAVTVADIFATALAAPREPRAILHHLRGAIGLILSAVTGIAAGFIVHPYFPGNLGVAWEQIVDIAIVGRTAGIPVGIEWAPLPVDEFFRTVGFLLPLLGLAVMGVIASAVRLATDGHPVDRERVAQGLAFSVLAVTFGVLTLHAQRHVEFFVPFAVLAIAVGAQPLIVWWWPPRVAIGWRRPGMIRRSLATATLLLAFVGFTIGSASAIRGQRIHFTRGFPADRLRDTATWLRDHAQVGAIIFHADWGDFPALFRWNRVQRYLVGLDPRFALLADADRTRRWLAVGRGDIPDTAAVIAREFGASYAIVTPAQEPLRGILDRDRNARLVHEDAEARVYALTR